MKNLHTFLWRPIDAKDQAVTSSLAFASWLHAVNCRLALSITRDYRLSRLPTISHAEHTLCPWEAARLQSDNDAHQSVCDVSNSMNIVTPTTCVILIDILHRNSRPVISTLHAGFAIGKDLSRFCFQNGERTGRTCYRLTSRYRNSVLPSHPPSKYNTSIIRIEEDVLRAVDVCETLSRCKEIYSSADMCISEQLQASTCGI